MSDANPLRGWRIDPARMKPVGKDLNRPECVLATRDGVLWVADGRGGIVRIDPDGAQMTIMASAASPDAKRPRVPNGIALMPDGRIMIANLAGGTLETGASSSEAERSACPISR